MSENWTAANVPDLSGKTIVITGGNSGIGIEAARVCVARGAQVFIGCRNPVKAEAAVQDLRTARADATVEAVPLDLASLASVRDCAEELADRAPVIDVLVNNAGIMMPPYETTEEGYESQFGVNHLGHFALTGRVLPSLLAAPAARVVNVSSLAHNWAAIDFDNLTVEGGRDYSPRIAYGRSKLANLLFTHGLQTRLSAAGLACIATTAHPGATQSNLVHHIAKNPIINVFLPLANRVFLQTAEQGALPTLRAAFDSSAKGDDYFGPDGIGELRGKPVPARKNKHARNSESAEKLWAASESLSGVVFEFT